MNRLVTRVSCLIILVGFLGFGPEAADRRQTGSGNAGTDVSSMRGAGRSSDSGSCAAGDTAQPPPPPVGQTSYVPSGYDLVWADEFKDLSLDPDGGNNGKRWAPWFVGFNVHYLSGNSDDAYKTTSAKAGTTLHEVKNGILNLYGKQKSYGGKPYVGGMISGQRSFSQTYGYFLISPEIATTWTGDPDDSTRWPMRMELDYVRIYKKNASGPPPPPPGRTVSS